MSRQTIHRGRVVDLGIETIDLPDGRHLELEVVRHVGGAAILALDGEGRICLLRQYRHAAGGWLWELPAGKLEPGEPAALTARRELAEEAGVEAGDWVELGAPIMSPGFCDERINLYLARGLSPVATAHEDQEVIEIHWKPLAEVRALIDAGELYDAKSLLALLLAERRGLLPG